MSLRSRVRQIAYRYWNPDEHGVAPHRHGFNHGPTLADACVAQDDPEHQGHANAVRIHQSDCRAQQRKVILDWVRERVERVDAAKEYLVTQWKFNSQKSSRVGERVIDWERTDGFGVNVEMVLI